MSGEVPAVNERSDGANPLHADEAMPIVYAELRRMAQVLLSGERKDHTLQPTALVHEAFMKLAGPSTQPREWESPEQFIGSAAEAMRRVLVDSARARKRIKRGGEQQRVRLNIDTLGDPTDRDEDVLEIHEALVEFSKSDPRSAKLVELRFFAGQTMASAAAVLSISLATAERDWAYARAWLNSFIRRTYERDQE